MRPCLGLFLLLIAGPSLADDAALQRCRQIDEASARLACYDAIPLPAANAASAARAGAAAEADGERTHAARNDAPSEFGLPARAPASDTSEIVARLVGEFDGWGPNARFTLDNGQEWQVVDGSSAFVTSGGPGVRVKRGRFGAYYLEIEGVNREPKVKRTR